MRFILVRAPASSNLLLINGAPEWFQMLRRHYRQSLRILLAVQHLDHRLEIRLEDSRFLFCGACERPLKRRNHIFPGAFIRKREDAPMKGFHRFPRQEVQEDGTGGALRKRNAKTPRAISAFNDCVFALFLSFIWRLSLSFSTGTRFFLRDIWRVPRIKT